MKKIFLTMASALVLFSATAASNVDKNQLAQSAMSRADRLAQSEMMMFNDCLDGFGLNAEEYELMMNQDYDVFDDPTVNFTVPTCASDATMLNGRGPGGASSDQPIHSRRLFRITPNDETDGGFDDMVKGNTRPGGTPSLDGSRPSGAWGDQPIHSRRLFSVNPSDETDGGFDDMVKGNTRPGGTPSLNGGRGPSWVDPIVRRVRTWSVDPSDETDGGFDDMVKGNTRPGGGTVSE